MTTNDKLGPCPLCGGEARHGTSAPVGETWNRLSSIAADARRVEELLRENIQLRLEQSARVLDTSEYRDLLEDRQKLLCEVFRMRALLRQVLANLLADTDKGYALIVEIRAEMKRFEEETK